MSQGPDSLAASRLEALFPPGAWRVGEDYVGMGLVHRLLRSGSRLAGEIRGRRADYWAIVTPEGTRCSSCQSPCRHAAAVAVAWIRDSGSFVDLDALVQTYLVSPSPGPLVEGLLEDDVLKALQGFTDGLFIPPFEEGESLSRLASLRPSEQMKAVSRLARLTPPRISLLARALALTPQLPFSEMSYLALTAPDGTFEPLAVWLQAHATLGDLGAFLAQVQALAYADASTGSVILRRAAKLLARLPGGEGAIGWLLEEPQANASLAGEVAGLLLAAGRPRAALHNLDRALLTASSDERLPLLRLAIRAAAEMGSPREGPLRLQAVAAGAWEEVQSLVNGHSALLGEEGAAILQRESVPPESRAMLALALGQRHLAFETARAFPLSVEVLRRVQAEAVQAGEDTEGFLLSHLTARERRRLRGRRPTARPGSPR